MQCSQESITGPYLLPDEASLYQPSSQESITGPYLLPDEASLYQPMLFPKVHMNAYQYELKYGLNFKVVYITCISSIL
jgi:hypothetical protein